MGKPIKLEVLMRAIGSLRFGNIVLDEVGNTMNPHVCACRCQSTPNMSRPHHWDSALLLQLPKQHQRGRA